MPSRNYGIDALRLLAMYMVVILHVLGCGGILESATVGSVNYYGVWLLETAAYCAVDVFAMISGYVMISAKFNVFKIIPLWLTVFFYSALITLLFRFVPFLTIIHAVSTKELISRIFLPVTSGTYWYFTSYFALFFFIPFINTLLLSLSKKQHFSLCATIITLFSLMPVLGLKHFDIFSMNWGYSAWWLISLYVIGAYLKVYPVTISKRKCIFLYFLSILVAWLSKIATQIPARIFLGRNIAGGIFIDYTSIFIITSGIALLLFFRQIKLNTAIQKAISFASPLAFSVYLIHTHPIIYNFVLKNTLCHLTNESIFSIFVKVLFIAFSIFIVCLFIDLFRSLLFSVLRIKQIPKILAQRFPFPL